MSRITTTALLAAAFLAVFLQAHASGVRRLLGTQVDLVTPLMVYAGVAGTPITVFSLAVLAGLCLDSLSANPLGASLLPLFVTGLLLQRCREFILGDQVQAQWVVGMAACAFNQILCLFLLAGMDRSPYLGWRLAWDTCFVAMAGAVITPAVFWLFTRFNRAFHHPIVAEESFRLDRQIKRGRH
jgi:cell shape-determining protein MreD